MKIKFVFYDSDLDRIESAKEFREISDTLHLFSYPGGLVLSGRQRYDPEQMATHVEIETRDEYPTPSEAIKVILADRSKVLERFIASE